MKKQESVDTVTTQLGTPRLQTLTTAVLPQTNSSITTVTPQHVTARFMVLPPSPLPCSSLPSCIWKVVIIPVKFDMPVNWITPLLPLLHFNNIFSDEPKLDSALVPKESLWVYVGHSYEPDVILASNQQYQSTGSHSLKWPQPGNPLTLSWLTEGLLSPLHWLFDTSGLNRPLINTDTLCWCLMHSFVLWLTLGGSDCY